MCRLQLTSQSSINRKTFCSIKFLSTLHVTCYPKLIGILEHGHKSKRTYYIVTNSETSHNLKTNKYNHAKFHILSKLGLISLMKFILRRFKIFITDFFNLLKTNQPQLVVTTTQEITTSRSSRPNKYKSPRKWKI